MTDPISFLEEYGTPNFKLYGQPNLMPYVSLLSGNAKCFCMRVSPDDATYSNVVIVAQTKFDEDPNDSTKKILNVKFTSKSISGLNDGDAFGLMMEGLTVESPEVNDQGYSEYPIFAIRCKGRGAYGNTFRVRVTSNALMDSENNYKYFKIFS